MTTHIDPLRRSYYSTDAGFGSLRNLSEKSQLNRVSELTHNWNRPGNNTASEVSVTRPG